MSSSASSQSSNPGPRIVVALDYDSAEPALALAASLDPTQCRLKVGKELFTRCGPSIVESLQTLGFGVFLDLKFHDIPNTCAKAVKAAADLGVWMVNVHASGGQAMMAAAREALESSTHKPLLIGVTVLTSMGGRDLTEIGITREPEQQVLSLARLVKSSGLDGVVCSAMEASALKAALGSDFITVTPGIRPVGSAGNDQQRIMTPEQAVKLGADYLVIGRPITQAADPLQACQNILATIA